MKGAWPLSLLNMYSIQLVALQALASRPHSSPRAFSLLEGASTSRQALYMAGGGGREKAETAAGIHRVRAYTGPLTCERGNPDTLQAGAGSLDSNH